MTDVTVINKVVCNLVSIFSLSCLLSPLSLGEIQHVSAVLLRSYTTPLSLLFGFFRTIKLFLIYKRHRYQALDAVYFFKQT